MDVYVKKSKLCGSCTVPGSKSATIRATLFGALADGVTTIHNPSPGADAFASVAAARALGAGITREETTNTWFVRGFGGKPSVPEKEIDTMNAGTTTSFVTGLCALLSDGPAVITGDEQIRRRPWKDEIDALNELGADCRMLLPGSSCPPMSVKGPIHGGTCHVMGHNSQHVSGLLAPCALLPQGETADILVSDPKETMYVDMTIDWLARFGVTATASPDHRHYRVAGGQRFTPCEVTVPADWSGAAFPLTAAALTDAELVITNLDFDDAQADKTVADILIRMGADIEKDQENGTVTVHGGKPLHGVDVDMDLIPDSLPVLAVAAAFAKGDSHFTNLAHVRIKETDRVAVMQQALTACGADVEITAESMTVHGGKPLTGTRIQSHSDHRVCMAMCVCGLACAGEMQIDDPACADVSFPGFFELMKKLGADIRIAG